ncbi:MAG: glycosyltransferase family 2 protein [Saprospiraceae bacterium]|nr:glycosyltransferase family 2 protein [Saprospiraceae bacterium]
MSNTAHRIDVIIPAFNEENGVERVIMDIPRELVREIVVCNNASTDQTARNARNAGATVVEQAARGYGNACLAGIGYLAAKPAEDQPDLVVFIDADYSDYPEQLPAVVRPIVEEDYDLVIGSRALGNQQKGSMQPQQIFGNWLATCLIRLFYKYRFTDLGPFRAIKWRRLLDLDMQDRTYGWTVEMQVKAAKYGLRCTEVPVDYRPRVGKSKVSGTVRGTVLAGHKILWTIFKLI